MSTPRAAAPLGRTLLLYLIVVVGLVTLAPFRFHVPEVLAVHRSGNELDVVTNAVLFVLPGFVFRLATGSNRDVYCVVPLLAFAALSLALEAGQLFLAGRYASPVDVVTNAAGAWAGAMVHDAYRRHVDPALTGRIVLELPLMGVVYLLVPLLWLHGFASEGRTDRLLVGVLPGIMGASVIAAVWVHRFRGRGRVGPNAVALGAAAWFLVAGVHGLRDAPGATLAAAAGIAAFTRLQLVGDWFHPTAERRFEGVTLRRTAPLLAVFVLLVDVWPWHAALPAAPLRASWWLSGIGPTPDMASMLAAIEHVAAATLGGYVLAESSGRDVRSDGAALARATLQAAAILAALEVLRGLHPAHTASALRLVFAVAGALCGAGIYRQQLHVVRAEIAARAAAAGATEAR